MSATPTKNRDDTLVCRCGSCAHDWVLPLKLPMLVSDFCRLDQPCHADVLLEIANAT